MEHLSWTKVVLSCHHIETSLFISRANQLTGFYMMTTLAFNELIRNKETVSLVGFKFNSEVAASSIYHNKYT